MSAERSPATGRRYPLTQVCRVYRVPRSTVYDTAARTASPQGPPSAKRGRRRRRPTRRSWRRFGPCSRPRRSWRGPPQCAGAPATAWPSGEPHPRVAADAAPRPGWRPNGPGIGTGTRRTPAPSRRRRPTSCGAPTPPGSTLRRRGGAGGSVAIDHASADIVGWHVAKIGDRWAALEPVHQGMRHAYGAFGKDVARGLALRSDWGPQYAADAFRNELTWLGHHAHAVVRRRAPVQWGHRALHPDPEGTVSLAPSLRDPGRGAGDHRGLHPTLQRGVDHRTARLSDPGHRPTGAGGGGLTKATACPKTGCATVLCSAAEPATPDQTPGALPGPPAAPGAARSQSDVGARLHG